MFSFLLKNYNMYAKFSEPCVALLHTNDQLRRDDTLNALTDSRWQLTKRRTVFV